MEFNNKSTNELINIYIESLNEIEKKALAIARKNLESSFNIEKSIGFIQWKQRYESNK